MEEALTDNVQAPENFSKIFTSDLKKKYNLGQDAFYSRLRYLQIKTYKDGGRAYLNAEQVTHMDALDKHIQATGRMNGYPVPEPSGPVDNSEETQSTGQLATVETEEITTASETPNYTPAQQRTQTQSDSINDVEGIVTSGQNIAAATMIAERMIARHYIDNPDLLPDELKSKIKEAGKVAAVDPFAFANSLMSMAGIAA
ncbi:hypothetical protein BCD64_00185 [Nostoc sp. MBR 210]|nr:hypothetical protein BCD64_00185 [Nostoc sp. MBR 210]